MLLVLGGVLLERQGAPATETCLFHRLTGHPCPTCGSTRVVLGLSQGAWREALRMNPLVTAGLALAAAWVAARLATGRRLVLDLSSRERAAALALGILFLLANWIWVLRIQR
jgi:hypothetical protein